MDKTDPNQPPRLSPDVGRTIPTSRRDPPLLEELAAGRTAQEPPRQPPPDDYLQLEEQFDWMAPLHNRLIIAGVSLMILLALTAVVLVVFSRGDGDPGAGPRVGVVGDDETTPTPDVSLTAIALTTTTLRNGPDASFSPIGTVPRGARVPIIGRNADDTWLQVVYPPGSTIQGWIDVLFLDVAGDLTGVDIAGPGAGPSIDVPTSVPTFVIEEPTDTPEPTDEATEEPTDRPAETPEPTITTTTPLATETAPPAETPAATEAQAPPPTEIATGLPPEATPTEGKPKASADRLTPPATLTQRRQLVDVTQRRNPPVHTPL